ncbi:26786_t:CDS:2 [Gigaspora margarita]|uniref:26786_t:CDS:1 n=1 Tax=Gigaspora margarita TaxID=4874 RepID=A0ABN7W425_GIGMA|nr:26786_t:CDS:2 [Gigaspora margarita]
MNNIKTHVMFIPLTIQSLYCAWSDALSPIVTPYTIAYQHLNTKTLEVKKALHIHPRRWGSLASVEVNEYEELPSSKSHTPNRKHIMRLAKPSLPI